MPGGFGGSQAVMSAETGNGTTRRTTPATRPPEQAGHKAQEAGRKAAGAGRRAADSPVVTFLGRAGFLARGVEYVVIGWIAVEVAFGKSATQADKSGALEALSKNPAGLV